MAQKTPVSLPEASKQADISRSNLYTAVDNERIHSFMDETGKHKRVYLEDVHEFAAQVKARAGKRGRKTSAKTQSKTTTKSQSKTADSKPKAAASTESKSGSAKAGKNSGKNAGSSRKSGAAQQAPAKAAHTASPQPSAASEPTFPKTGGPAKGKRKDQRSREAIAQENAELHDKVARLQNALDRERQARQEDYMRFLASVGQEQVSGGQSDKVTDLFANLIRGAEDKARVEH